MRLSFLRVLDAGVVSPVVVIVPGRQNRAVLTEFLKAWLRAEHLILMPEHIHVFGVAVDIISDHQKQFRVGFDDGFPDGLRLRLLRA